MLILIFKGLGTPTTKLLWWGVRQKKDGGKGDGADLLLVASPFSEREVLALASVERNNDGERFHTSVLAAEPRDFGILESKLPRKRHNFFLVLRVVSASESPPFFSFPCWYT